MIPIPQLTIIPDFTTPPRYAMAAATDIVRIGAAPAIALFPETEATHLFNFGFKLTSRAEAEGMEDFFIARGGKCRPFYLPSWRDDLNMVESSAETITVDAITLAAGHGDHYQRALFIWQGDDLLITRWTSTTDGGATRTFRLEQPLTFTPEPGKAMVGWAHLVRFADDRQRFKYRLPGVTDATEIGFRAPRFWSSIEDTITLTPAFFAGHPGWSEFRIREDELAAIETRVGYALGPTSYNADGAPGTRWAIWQGADGIPRIKATAGTITLPDATGTASTLFSAAVTLDRLSVTFDHDGREHVAFADSTAGTIEARWYDGSTATAQWDGYDPVMCYTYHADTAMDPGDRAVICFYLRLGDNRILYRRQDEAYATEHAAITLPVKPLELRGMAESSSFSDLLIADVQWRLCTLVTNP